MKHYAVEDERIIVLEPVPAYYKLSDKELLELAIEKWKLVARYLAGNSERTIDDQGTVTCPLCRRYFRDTCQGCPINDYSREFGCANTPYDDFCIDPSAKMARKEVKFLQEVLANPEKQ
jgi:hypothetical protein